MSLWRADWTIADPRLSVTVPPDPEALAIPLDVVAEDHLHVLNGGAEDRDIARIVRAATGMAQWATQRTILPQTLTLHLESGKSRIVLPGPPLIAVEAVEVLDSAGVWGELVADVDYVVWRPEGPRAASGEVRSLAGWPSGPVRVRYRAGYAALDDDGAEVPAVPDDLAAGILLIVGELYAHGKESVQDPNNTPSVLRSRDIFAGFRVF